MCQGVGRTQRGRPINPENMEPGPEKTFWEDFFQTVDREIEAAGGMDQDRLIIPSSALRRKYREAIEQHDGEDACQIRQLVQVFDFSAELKDIYGEVPAMVVLVVEGEDDAQMN